MTESKLLIEMKNKGQNQSNLNEPNNRSYLNLSKPQGLNYFTSPTVHWLENIEPANPAALLEENATPNLGPFAALKAWWKVWPNQPYC